MDRSSGFGRLASLGAMTMAFSGGGVATALAQELYGAGRADRLASPPAHGAPPRLGRNTKAQATATGAAAIC